MYPIQCDPSTLYNLEKAKNLLVDDKIGECLFFLIEALGEIGKHLEQNEFILLSAQLKRVEKAYDTSTIDFQTNSIEQSKIIRGILNQLNYGTLMEPPDNTTGVMESSDYFAILDVKYFSELLGNLIEALNPS